MVKGCMLRLGYNGELNKANYLKACFPRLYKFLIHYVLLALSHRKGGYDVMRDYQMNMVTTLVLNKNKTWVYPCFIQMMIDHAYPDLERNENNDLLVLFHMDNESLKQLGRYHPNHPEPSSKVEFFGFIKDKNYHDPDPINHQNWRDEEEMKEKSYADELKILENFRESRNEWFLKEEKKKKGRKATPKAQEEEGSSSQPKRKHQKKKVETMLVDEPDEDEPEAKAETEAEVNVEGDVHVSPRSAKFLEDLNMFNAEQEKTADDVEGDDGDKSSSSSSDEEIDETERARRVKAEIEKEKQLKRKRKEDKEDELYNPSPEHVIESQTPPSSGGRKKQSARKKVATPRAKGLKILLKKKPVQTPSKSPSPPPEPQPQISPIHSPLHQSPPRQPSLIQSPLHLSPQHIHIATPLTNNNLWLQLNKFFKHHHPHNHMSKLHLVFLILGLPTMNK
ncbi:hypothetical protein Hanom_Chr16g01466111 [Helianthus anomalus]